MSGNAQLLTDSLESVYVRWVWGRGPIYIELVVTNWPNHIFKINFFWNFFLFKRNADSEKMNGKYFVGDPLTHLCNQSNIPA